MYLSNRAVRYMVLYYLLLNMMALTLGEMTTESSQYIIRV